MQSQKWLGLRVVRVVVQDQKTDLKIRPLTMNIMERFSIFFPHLLILDIVCRFPFTDNFLLLFLCGSFMQQH